MAVVSQFVENRTLGFSKDLYFNSAPYNFFVKVKIVTENSRAQLEVKYHGLNVTVNFFDISTISSFDEAFKRFVDEFFLAFDLIKQLRKMYDEVTSSAEKQEISELLYNAVTVTVDCFDSVQTYLREYAIAKRNLDEDSDKAQIEELWGQCVHELRAPTFALKGYVELIYQVTLPEPYEEKRSEYLAGFDRFLENNLVVLTAYKKHLAGEIDLYQYQTDELIDKIKLENNL